ncbi:hypothetical protein KDJ21_004045 [Metabacillus litoralis]|uniref:hypothetical protein n=1 Tax=Bacillaceae TaxID=186817 RepID=UPI001B943694|nr:MULTISPECIES: hypothetical protein [Bacillaceae]MCK6208325.1 hypothetical protein [Bacillus infantis]UHA60883.1 hypothetical protein KDJ21_004045 [Metabacillus litoralis]
MMRKLYLKLVPMEDKCMEFVVNFHRVSELCCELQKVDRRVIDIIMKIANELSDLNIRTNEDADHAMKVLRKYVVFE